MALTNVILLTKTFAHRVKASYLVAQPPYFNVHVKPSSMTVTRSGTTTRVLPHHALQDVFESYSNQPDPCRYFIALTGRMPSRRKFTNVNTEALLKQLTQRYNGQIIEMFDWRSHRSRRNETREAGLWMVHLEGDRVVSGDVGSREVNVYFMMEHRHEVEPVFELVHRTPPRRRKKQTQLYVLVIHGVSIELEPMALNVTKLDIDRHYNDDFAEVHRTIEQRLRRKNDKGIIMLHGRPGTGKTSYLRHLVSRTSKRVIFIPPDFAERLTDPQFLSLLMENPNAVLVIEDAERIMSDREREGHSPVSVLLNLADGLLSDCLNLQIICTFNTDLSRVDKALMRKGRLIARYCFGPLHHEKAAALLAQEGRSFTHAQGLTLADIYNDDLPSPSQPVETAHAIGFKPSP